MECLPHLLNFVTAVNYHFGLDLPETFSQPGKNSFGDPCKFNHSGYPALSREVAEDETIYISYTNLHHPPDKRRAALREQYYFDCGCARCCEGDIKVGKGCVNKLCRITQPLTHFYRMRVSMRLWSPPSTSPWRRRGSRTPTTSVAKSSRRTRSLGRRSSTPTPASCCSRWASWRCTW